MNSIIDHLKSLKIELSKPCEGGLINNVWYGKKNNSDVVIKIIEDKKKYWKIRKEASVMDSFKENNYFSSLIEYNFFNDLAYLLIEKKEGINAEEKIPNTKEFYFECGKLMANIHEKFCFEKYGFLYELDKFGQDPSLFNSETIIYSNPVDQIRHKLFVWTDFLKSKKMNFSQELDSLLLSFDFPSNMPDNNPVLCHGDFLLKNLIEKNGKLSGICDFELMFSGDASFDLHMIKQDLFENKKNNLFKYLIEGYETINPIPESFEPLNNLYRIFNATREIFTLPFMLKKLNSKKHKSYLEKINIKLINLINKTDKYLI